MTASGPVSKSALMVLFSVVFLDNLGFAIVLPYLFFFARSLGASTFEYGILLGSYSLMSFLFTPIVARLSDRHGRRRILLVALAVSSFSYFLFGTANIIPILFVSRMLAGTTAATVPIAQAYVADVTTKSDRLKYLGLLGAAAGIAFILGPAIGGTLSELFGYAVPSFLASALAFINLISANLRLPEPSRSEAGRGKTVISLKALTDVLRKKQMVLLLSIYFSFFVAFVFMQSSLSPWLEAVFGFGSFQAGIVFFFLGGVSAFSQAVLLPKLSKKFNRLSLTLYSTLLFALGLSILAAVQNLFLLFVITALIAFSFGMQYITINTLISLNAPLEAQGGTLGVAWAIASLAQTIAPTLATTAFAFGVSQKFSGIAFIVSAFVSGITFLLILSFRKIAKEQG